MEPFLLHQRLEQHQVVLSFQGTVTPNLSLGALDAIERYTDACKETTWVRRKVFNVLVECLHNLFHHPSPRLESNRGIQLPEKSGILMVRWTESGYEVSVGNYVHAKKAQWLRSRISEINSCSPEMLKKLYRSVLVRDERTEVGGGGLGFIDIVRRSGAPIHFEFHPVDDYHDFFVYTARITRHKPSN